MSNERKMGELCLWLTTLFSGKNVNVNLLLIVRHCERNPDDICPLSSSCARYYLIIIAFSAETNQTLIATCHYLTSFRAISVLTDHKKGWQFLKNFYTRTCKQRLGTTPNVQRFRMVISNFAWIEYNDLDVPIPNTIHRDRGLFSIFKGPWGRFFACVSWG